jgi:hypothetical protein
MFFKYIEFFSVYLFAFIFVTFRLVFRGTRLEMLNKYNSWRKVGD